MLKKLAKCVGEYKWHAIKTPIYVACECVFDVIIPFLMAFLIDEGINKGNSGMIIKIGVTLIICSIFASSFSFFGTFVLPATILRISFKTNRPHLV